MIGPEYDGQPSDLGADRKVNAWNTPVYDNLRLVDGTRQQILVETAIENYIATRTPQVIFLMGPPGTGKTTLAGEIAAQAVTSGLDPEQDLKFVTWENSQKIVNNRGFRRDRTKESSPATKKHYKLANEQFSIDVSNAARKGGIVIIETPGLIRRGEQTAIDCANHTGRFAELNYDDSYIFLTLGPSTAAPVREVYLSHPDEKLDAIEAIGGNVDIESEISSIPGGDKVAVEVFRKALARALFKTMNELADEKPEARLATLPSYFEPPSQAAGYLERVYLPKMIEGELHIPKEKYLIARNFDRPTHELYQALLTRISTQKTNY